MSVVVSMAKDGAVTIPVMCALKKIQVTRIINIASDHMNEVLFIFHVLLFDVLKR